MPALLLLLIFLSAICEAGFSENTQRDERTIPIKKRRIIYFDHSNNTVSIPSNDKLKSFKEVSNAIDLKVKIIKEPAGEDHEIESDVEPLLHSAGFLHNKNHGLQAPYTVKTYSDGSGSCHYGNEIKRIIPISSLPDEHNGETGHTLIAVNSEESNLPSAAATYYCEPDSNSNHANGTNCTNRVSVICINQNNIEKNPYQCQICGKRFRFVGSLTRHQLIHTGIKRHQCQQCGKYCTQLCNLKSHELTHTSAKPFKCESCDRCFSQSRYLARHMKTHTEVRRYQCDSCGECFAQSRYLTKHMKAHTGYRPNQCDSCGKCFAQPGGLTKHMIVHTGPRPYKCRLCSKDFAYIYSRNRHEKTHKSENTSTGTGTD